MWIILFVALFGTAALTSACAVAMSGGFRAEAERLSPDYARRIFTPAGDMLWANAWPVRVVPLFSEPVPRGLESTVSLLRWLYGVQLTIVGVAFAVVAGTLGWHVLA